MSHLIERLRESLSSAGEPPVTKSWPAAAMPAPGERDSAGGADGEAPANAHRPLSSAAPGGGRRQGHGLSRRGPRSRRSVALKLPHFTGSSEAQEQARQRFLREARAAAACAMPTSAPFTTSACRTAHPSSSWPTSRVAHWPRAPARRPVHRRACGRRPGRADGHALPILPPSLPRGGRIADTIGPDAGRAVTPHW